jgi:hypothetical protein
MKHFAAAGLRVGVVLGEHGDRHRVLGQDVEAHHVVRQEVDRVDRDELPVHVHREPVVRVGGAVQGVGHRGLHDAVLRGGLALATAALPGLRVLRGERDAQQRDPRDDDGSLSVHCMPLLARGAGGCHDPLALIS